MTDNRTLRLATILLCLAHGEVLRAQGSPANAEQVDGARAYARVADSAYANRAYALAEQQYLKAVEATSEQDSRRPWFAISRSLALIAGDRHAEGLRSLADVQRAHGARLATDAALRAYLSEVLAFAAWSAPGSASDTLLTEDLKILRADCPAANTRCDWWVIRAVAGRRHWATSDLTDLVYADTSTAADSLQWRRGAWRAVGAEIGRRAADAELRLPARTAMSWYDAAATAMQRAGEVDRARRWLSRRGYLAAVMGDSLRAAGDVAGARAHYEIAVAAGDDTAAFAQANHAAMQLALLYLDSGDVASAERAFRTALRLARERGSPRAAGAYEGLALLALGEGRRDLHAAYLDSALAAADSNAVSGIRDRRRFAAAGVAQEARAASVLDSVAAADADAGVVLRAMRAADSLRNAGDYPSAVAQLQPLLHHPERLVRAQALLSLSGIEFVRDNLPAAWQAASDAVSLMPVRELVEMANVQLATVLSVFPERDSLVRAESLLDRATRQLATSVDAGGAEAEMLELQERFEIGFDLLVWTRVELAPMDATGRITDSSAVWSVIEAVERGRSRVAQRLSRRRANVGMSGNVDSVRAAYRAIGRDVVSFSIDDVNLVRAFVPVRGQPSVQVTPHGGDEPWVLEEWQAALGVRSATHPESRGIKRRGRLADSTLTRTAKLLGIDDVTRQLAPGDELVILPDAALSLVPFAALPLGDDATRLGVRHPLRLLPSAEFNGPSGASNRSRSGTALVVGNPSPLPRVAADGGALRFAELPGAEAEAGAVSRVIGTSLVLRGPQATETSVRQAIPEASLVHIASHAIGYAPRDRERDSFVALGTGDGLDGRLTVAEIVDGPRLRAELVVLSACQTALGTLRGGEGALGFQRAFLIAGSASVMASYWEVPDAATAFLMERFYTHWLRDADRPSKSIALFRAQADMRAGAANGALPAQWAEPAAWAGFALYGAP